MYITFEKALKRQHKDVILEGNIKVKMKNNKFRKRMELIKDGIPIQFSRINAMLREELTDLEYIKFWEGIKIIEVNYYE